ncbi:MAG: hypothetical protein ACKERG_04490 [Candidatus Hodgkinia cicadicola]
MFCYISKTKLDCLIYYEANVLLGKSLNALKLNTSNTNNPLFKLKGTDLKVTSASTPPYWDWSWSWGATTTSICSSLKLTLQQH